MIVYYLELGFMNSETYLVKKLVWERHFLSLSHQSFLPYNDMEVIGYTFIDPQVSNISKTKTNMWM